MQPVLTGLKKVDNTMSTGTRLIYLTWKIAAKEKPDGYHVTIKKASGEPPIELLNVTDTEITLNLSCSAYTVAISAFNNVSVSQAQRLTIQKHEDIIDADHGRLNVTVHNSTSFTVYWRLHVLKNYVCYSVEWSEKHQQAAAYMSFFEKAQNYKRLDFSEPLELYKRYRLYLHTRSNKETCNMKHVNNGERTYGSTHFYYMEGTPISAPTNISCLKVTASSVVLQWSPIPEDDLRGFLLGYIIYYKEYNTGVQTEKNWTVDAAFTSCKLEDLKTGTGYHVQISGFTRAGTGNRSFTSFFKTYDQDNWKDHVIVIIFVATSIIILIAASPLLKRTKVILWPTIPNPENSSAVQKIEKFYEMELIQTMTVEEWDSNSLQIIEEAVALRSLEIHFTTEERADSLDTAPGWTRDILNHSDREHSGLVESQTALNCGYTTMEMFRQSLIPQSVSAKDMDDTKRELDDFVLTKPGHEYIGQF